jgi:hypothetical protein
MQRLVVIAGLLTLTYAWLPAAHAEAKQQVDLSQSPVPISQIIRQAGYSLTDAEATYLDGEQQLQAEYVRPLTQIMMVAGAGSGVPEGTPREAIVSELQRLVAMDPNASPSAPESLQPLRELAVRQRAAIRRAASLWLEALQAGDTEWRARGGDAFAEAQQSLLNWQQELGSRYPPPHGQQ